MSDELPSAYRTDEPSLHWHRFDAKHPPFSNEAVYVWVPGLGNDDEGYGLAIIAHFHFDKGCFYEGRTWVGNRPLRVTHWCYLPHPEDPEPVTDAPTCSVYLDDPAPLAPVRDGG